MDLQAAEGPCVRILAAAEGWHCLWTERLRSGTESMLIENDVVGWGEDMDEDVGGV
jgi:hypothetical protein